MKSVEEKGSKKSLPVPSDPSVASMARMLSPIASDDDLVAAFKRYVELKEKLLEDSDYVYSVIFPSGTSEDRKFFPVRDDAERFAAGLISKRIAARMEKKIKKSGCLKLGKAFGISVTVLAEERGDDFVRFLVRASAPNGQHQDRTGRCDRKEKGRSEKPFDHLEATAMTRAADRAIMALLGGETTAEEFEEVVEPAPVAASDPIPAQVPPAKLSDSEFKEAINKQFGSTEAAKVKDVAALRRELFAVARAGGVKDEQVKMYLKAQYKVESTKDLNEAQLLSLIQMYRKVERK